MLSSFKSKAAEQDRNTAANADELTGRTVQPSHTVVEQVASGPEPTATRKTGRDSCIGSGMSIVGKIECNGPAQVFGRIEGELRASDLLVGEGAQVEGSVIAQNVTTAGCSLCCILRCPRAGLIRLVDSGGLSRNARFSGSPRVAGPRSGPPGCAGQLHDGPPINYVTINTIR